MSALETLERVPDSPEDLALLPTLPEWAIITGALSEKQILSIVECRQRRLAVWVGAVSAGKTFASLIAFLEAVRTAPRGETIVIIGKTLQTIERNVIAQLVNPRLMGELADATIHTTGSNHAIILGRRVELIGAYNAGAEERIRGGTFGLAYVDEATLLPEEFWNMLITRLRVDGSRLLATTNPASKNHWLRKKWLLQSDRQNLITFHLTMDDNPGLPGWYIAQMKASYSGLFYDRFILGLWTNAEGAVYPMFDPTRHVLSWLRMPVISDILCVGIDHGTTNATSAIMLGITAEVDERNRPTPRLILMDEWRYESSDDPQNPKARLTNVEQSALLRTWLRRSHYPGDYLLAPPRFVFVDPAAADFREQLKRDKVYGLQPADNSVLEGIGDVSSLFGQDRLLVMEPKDPETPGCAGFLDEVTEYAWDAKKSELGEDVPAKVNDHSMDAARYAVRSSRSWWFPIMQQAYGLAA